jgi:hypothetical protein
VVKKESAQKLQHISGRKCLGGIGIKQSKRVAIFAPKKRNVVPITFTEGELVTASEKAAGNFPAFFL